MPKVPLRLCLLLSTLLVSPACVGGPPIVTASAAGCTQLLPADWKDGVPPADLPSGDSAGDWVAFADAQTGRLDVANDRTKSAIGIVERCEARDAAVVKQARKGWLARLFS